MRLTSQGWLVLLAFFQFGCLVYAARANGILRDHYATLSMEWEQQEQLLREEVFTTNKNDIDHQAHAYLEGYARCKKERGL